MASLKAVKDAQLFYLIQKINDKFDTKVDKVEGKALSTNDFTNELLEKLNGIAAGAEVNQNAFANIVVGENTVVAGAKSDSVSLVNGDNVTMTAEGAAITINAKDTRYTFETGDNNGEIKVTPNDGGEAKAVAVKGLGSAAFANTSAFDAAGSAAAVKGESTDTADKDTVFGAKAAAAAAQGAAEAAQATADAAMPIAGGAFTGAVTLHADPTADLQAATKKYVDDAKAGAIATAAEDATSKADAALVEAKKYADAAVVNLTGAMHFEGALAEIPTDNTGYEKGDVVLVANKEYVFDGSNWVELGDEGSYALKSLKINGYSLTGDITLTPTDIGADAAGTAKELVEALDYTYEGEGNYVTEVSQVDGKIAVTKGTLPTVLPNPTALTVGSKVYDGTAAVSITADDLMTYVTNEDIDAMFAGTYTV